MGVNSLPKAVTRQRDCDLNPGPSAPESSTLTTRIPSHPKVGGYQIRPHFPMLSKVGGDASDEYKGMVSGYA